MRRALAGLEGIKSIKLRFEDKEFDVTYIPKLTDPEKMVEAIQGVGFEANVVSGEEGGQ
ncbi:MAG: heavy-metal-associated domain-containing protein [Planctomycetota bacterium]